MWRDFVSAYKQTILGPAWHVIQPLLTTLTFTLIFNRVVGLSTDGTPAFLFYMAGTVPWTYFANTLERTSNTFVFNAPLLGKVYFHRLGIPVSVVISNLITLAVRAGIFLLLLAGYAISGISIHVTPWVLLSPLLVVMLAGYGLGGGVIVSALTTRYRDLANLVGFGVQLLMYATPIIYPVSSVPARYQWIVRCNPLTPIIEGFRLGFLGAGSVELWHVGASLAGMVAILLVGLTLFTHVERTFMDTI